MMVLRQGRLSMNNLKEEVISSAFLTALEEIKDKAT